jgi:hypothetical protein
MKISPIPPRCANRLVPVVLSIAVLATAGCGTAADLSTATTAPAATAATTQTTATPLTTVSEGSPATTFGAIFEAMAQAMAPLPVYGLAELPAEAVLPPDWWPVIELNDPAEYEGESLPNPRIMGEGSPEPQAQLVLKIQDGWLLLYENLRGDLGDVAGDPVGTVAGHQASLYDVNGGSLVQWSDGGRWYGVFGRGVAVERLTGIALSAYRLSPK